MTFRMKWAGVIASAILPVCTTISEPVVQMPSAEVSAKPMTAFDLSVIDAKRVEDWEISGLA